MALPHTAFFTPGLQHSQSTSDLLCCLSVLCVVLCIRSAVLFPRMVNDHVVDLSQCGGLLTPYTCYFPLRKVLEFTGWPDIMSLVSISERWEYWLHFDLLELLGQDAYCWEDNFDQASSNVEHSTSAESGDAALSWTDLLLARIITLKIWVQSLHNISLTLDTVWLTETLHQNSETGYVAFTLRCQVCSKTIYWCQWGIGQSILGRRNHSICIQQKKATFIFCEAVAFGLRYFGQRASTFPLMYRSLLGCRQRYKAYVHRVRLG